MRPRHSWAWNLEDLLNASVLGFPAEFIAKHGCSARLLLAFLAVGAVENQLVAADPPVARSAVVIHEEGSLEVTRVRAAVWDQAYTNQVLLPEDQLRTLEGELAVLRMSDQTLVRVGELSQIQMPAHPRKRSSLGF